MELSEINHIQSDHLQQFEPDIYIAASGYESRASFVTASCRPHAKKHVALAFTEHRNDLARPKNDQFFSNLGFEFIPVSGYSIPDYDHLFENNKGASIQVMIDISCMTKKWYYGLLHYFSSSDHFASVQLIIVYTPATFDEPLQLKKQVSLHTYSMNNPIIKQDREKNKRAVIMGLGNVRRLGYKIMRQLQPDYTLLMYADPPSDKKYVESIFANNHEVIEHVPIRHLIGYPIHNARLIYQKLIDALLPLRNNHTITIVPMGPKLFALISFIAQMSYPDVHLSYPSFSVKKRKDRKSDGSIIGLQLQLDRE